jgi:hypothetical protein
LSRWGSDLWLTRSQVAGLTGKALQTGKHVVSILQNLADDREACRCKNGIWRLSYARYKRLPLLLNKVTPD